MMPKAMNIVVSGLVGLLVFSSPSASQDHVVPLDESLTILEWAEVSCQRRSKIGPKGGVKLVHFL